MWGLTSYNFPSTSITFPSFSIQCRVTYVGRMWGKKVKLCLCWVRYDAMKSCGDAEVPAPQCQIEVTAQLHCLAALALEKEPQDPLDRRLSGPRAGLDAVDWRKSSCPCRKSSPGLPAISLVALPTELSRRRPKIIRSTVITPFLPWGWDGALFLIRYYPCRRRVGMFRVIYCCSVENKCFYERPKQEMVDWKKEAGTFNLVLIRVGRESRKMVYDISPIAPSGTGERMLVSSWLIGRRGLGGSTIDYPPRARCALHPHIPTILFSGASQAVSLSPHLLARMLDQ